MDWVGRFDCMACRGLACMGGGNLDCAQRDPVPSVLAGVLDPYGGARFVITHEDCVRHHVRCDETPVVVTDLFVHEPIAWNDIPVVVARIEYEIDRWLERGTPNDPHQQQAAVMYRLRQLENPHSKRALNLEHICET